MASYLTTSTHCRVFLSKMVQYDLLDLERYKISSFDIVKIILVISDFGVTSLLVILGALLVSEHTKGKHLEYHPVFFYFQP